MGKSTIDWWFSIATFDYRRVSWIYMLANNGFFWRKFSWILSLNDRGICAIEISVEYVFFKKCWKIWYMMFYMFVYSMDNKKHSFCCWKITINHHSLICTIMNPWHVPKKHVINQHKCEEHVWLSEGKLNIPFNHSGPWLTIISPSYWQLLEIIGFKPYQQLLY